MEVIASLDESIVRLLNSLLVGNNATAFVVKALSVYVVYFIPVIWIIWWFVAGEKQRFLLLSSMLAGIFAWQGLNRFIKLFYERPRPIHEITVKELLFERPENSFPSDHAAFLSAIAFFFLLQRQKSAGIWLLVAAVASSLARVAVAVHYPSDIIMGFLDGFIVAWLIHVIHGRLSATLWATCLKIAQKLRLG